MAALLAVYGLLLQHRLTQVLAAMILAFWAALAGSKAYLSLRLVILGLDYICLSFLLFGMAILISLCKSGLRRLVDPAKATESAG